MVDPVHLSVDGESGVVVGRGVATQVHGRRHPEDWAVALVSLQFYIHVIHSIQGFELCFGFIDGKVRQLHLG
jgi:hypothetical protein